MIQTAYPRLRKLLSQKGRVLSDHDFLELIKALKSNPENVSDSWLGPLTKEENQPQSLPLELLFNKLRISGIDVDTATVLDIQKVLATPALVPKALEMFQLTLRALICKSKVQQEKFDTVFEEFLSETKTFLNLQSGRSGTFRDEILQAYQDDTKGYNRKKYFRIGLSLLALIPIVWLTYFYFFTSGPIGVTFRSSRFFPIDSTRSDHVVGDSILLEARVTNPRRSVAPDEQVYWILNKDTIEGEIHKIKIDSAGMIGIKVLLFKSEELLAQTSGFLSADCEKIPEVSIVRLSDASLGIPIRYEAEISNPSVDSIRYEYSWWVNDKKVSTTSTLDTILQKPAVLAIRVKVTFPKDMHCSVDSLSDELDETIGGIPFSVTGEGTVGFTPEIKPSTLGMAVAALLLVFLLGYSVLVRTLTNRRTQQAIGDDDGEEEPHSLKFKKQNVAVQVNRSVVDLAINFNKRQQSEEVMVDVKRTVMRTARAGGFPMVSFSQKTKKQSFLFLIDSAVVKGHQQKLLDFLMDFLRRNQVELFCFTYYRYPDTLRNQDLKLEPVSLEYLNKNYNQSSLMIFSSSDYFFDSKESAMLDWVYYIKNHWSARTLVTLKPQVQWDFKEIALRAEGFNVVPHSLSDLMRSLFQDADDPGKEVLNSYSSQRDWEDIHQLEMFLEKDHLRQWVYALAVYPSPSWELTLAIGSKLESHFPDSKPMISYTNLEKLTQIGWLNDGIISDDLRAEMLSRLDSKVHMLARQTLHELLDQVKSEINPTSTIWNEFQMHNTVNEFVLKGLENDREYLQKNLRKIEALRNTGNLDAAVDVSLSDGLPIYEATVKSEKWKGFPHGYYARLFLPLLATVAFMLIAMTVPQIRTIFATDTSDTIKFILRSSTDNTTLDHASLSLRLADRTLTPDTLHPNSFFVTGLSTTDVRNASTFRLDLKSGDSLVQNMALLNKINYITLEDSVDKRVPVAVFYNDPDYVKDAEKVMAALAANKNFWLSQALELNESISATAIEASNRFYKDIFDLLTVTVKSDATPPTQSSGSGIDTSSIAERITINLYYKQGPEPPPPTKSDWKIVKTTIIESSEGLELKEFEIEGNQVTTTIYAAIIDQSVYRPSILGISKENPDGIVPSEIAKTPTGEVKVMIGSGFVENFRPIKPNGFLKVEGEVINGVKRNGYNGIAGVRSDRLQLLTTASSVAALHGGFQTGPFLVRDGMNVYNRDTRGANLVANRAFIGVNKSGKIVAAVTEGNVSLIELSEFLSTSNAADLRCVTALNLAGGGSEVLTFRDDKGELNGYGNYTAHQPAVIAFLRSRGSTPPVVPEEEPTPEYCTEALDAVNKGDKTLAESLARKALVQNSNNVDCLFILGFVTNDVQESVRSYLKVLELDPKYPMASNNLGFTYMSLLDYDNALKYLLEANSLSKHELTLMNLGDVYRYKTDFAQALAYHLLALEEVENNAKNSIDAGSWNNSFMPVSKGDQRSIQQDIALETTAEKKSMVLFAMALDDIFLGNLSAVDKNFNQSLEVLKESKQYQRIILLFRNRAESCRLIQGGTKNNKLEEIITTLSNAGKSGR